MDRAAGNEAALKIKWDEACEFFHAWDEKIQDTLASGSFSVASGYQLGRGLSDIDWVLDPEVGSDDPRSWSFLLGGSRLVQIKRLLTRLADYFPRTTAESVTNSLGAWAGVVRDPAVRGRADTYPALHEQIRNWHDALLLEQPLTDRVSTGDLLTRARSFRPVLRAFLPEATVALLGFVAAGAAAALFAVGGVSHAVAPILTIFDGFGITSAGALARAKNEAHSLFAPLHQAMNADLATWELTVLPAQAYLDTGRGPINRSSRNRAIKRLRRPTGSGAAAAGLPEQRRLAS